MLFHCQAKKLKVKWNSSSIEMRDLAYLFGTRAAFSHFFGIIIGTIATIYIATKGIQYARWVILQRAILIYCISIIFQFRCTHYYQHGFACSFENNLRRSIIHHTSNLNVPMVKRNPMNTISYRQKWNIHNRNPDIFRKRISSPMRICKYSIHS